jgi:hypothetical protein
MKTKVSKQTEINQFKIGQPHKEENFNKNFGGRQN